MDTKTRIFSKEMFIKSVGKEVYNEMKESVDALDGKDVTDISIIFDEWCVDEYDDGITRLFNAIMKELKDDDCQENYTDCSELCFDDEKEDEDDDEDFWKYQTLFRLEGNFEALCEIEEDVIGRINSRMEMIKEITDKINGGLNSNKPHELKSLLEKRSNLYQQKNAYDWVLKRIGGKKNNIAG